MPAERPFSKLTYQASGVDLQRADQLIERIKTLSRPTQRPELLSGIGGFAALCELPTGYRQPVLVSCTDGVGTKLCLAKSCDELNALGQDLVAMCVNDLIVSGAKPLLFQDYYACGRIDPVRSEALMTGIAKACEKTGCSLAGGETAEMPGVYPDDGFDLAGFSLGVVEKTAIIDGSKIQAGDLVVGLASNGVHANGFSLVRAILKGVSKQQAESLQNELMAPTRLYPTIVQQLSEEVILHGLAHITGGGIAANLSRILPEQLQARLDLRHWERPSIFQRLQALGEITAQEMLRTFNCGLGMLCIIPANQRAQAEQCLQALGEPFMLVGEIVHRADRSLHVELLNVDDF